MYNFPQSAKFNGVRIMAEMVATAVRLTDKAMFPFANEDMKLEMFPPGHDETKIIPKAIVGVIRLRKIIIITNVTAGRKKNCEKKPKMVDFGFEMIRFDFKSNSKHNKSQRQV